jgi:PHAX RNA-binding domain
MSTVKVPAPLDKGGTKMVAYVANELGEPNLKLLTRVYRWLGHTPFMSLVRDAQRIQADGGMPRADGLGQRTPGGILFALAKQRLDRRGWYWVFGANRTHTPASTATMPAAPPPLPPAPAPLPSVPPLAPEPPVAAAVTPAPRATKPRKTRQPRPVPVRSQPIVTNRLANLLASKGWTVQKG